MDRKFDVRGKSWKMCIQQDSGRWYFVYGLGGRATWGRVQTELVGGSQNFSDFEEIDYRYFAHRSAD